MLEETTSARSRSFKRLNGPGGLVTIRKSCLSRLEAEHDRLQRFATTILAARKRQTINVHFFDYAFLALDPDDNNMVLHATHDAGLFSCLTTIMWSILELQQLGLELPTRISNTFGMDRFKPELASNTFAQWFDQPTSCALKRLSEVKAQSLFNTSPRLFDHHGDYHDLYNTQLGPDWLTSYLQAYMKPSPRLEEKIEAIENKYNIQKLRTVVACYRGTDKHTELQQDPVSTYLEKAIDLADTLGAQQVLIQTDQQQVRSLFQQTFKGRCLFIQELPVTQGTVVLHQKLAGKIDVETWSMDLLAMVHACARASGVLSHTGNLGFFLSLLTLINGGKLVQLR